jgi:antitoxin component YwqK of YwqJK toxin-antitoxin module
MGLGVKNSDFYESGVDFLVLKNNLEINGLTREVNQNGQIVNFVVPIIKESSEQYALVCLEKIQDKWNVYHSEILENHSGRSFNFTLSSFIKKEYHENGELSFEGDIINGNKEGTCKWYYENGQLRELSIWHNNLPQGEISMYHSNGQMKTIASFKNGQKDGKATTWYENGQFNEVLNYKNDLLTGEYTSYHPNGQINERGIFDKSERVGHWEKYDENGNKI